MSVLQNAYELIQKGQLEDAKVLLDAHRLDFQDNADYWWLVAHATTDPEMGRAALGRVLLLDKDYPGARELDEEVRMVEQLASPSAPIRRTSRRRLPLLAIAAVAVVALLVIGIGTVVLFSNTQTDTTAAVTDIGTEVPVVMLATMTPTEADSTFFATSPAVEPVVPVLPTGTDAGELLAEIAASPTAMQEPPATATLTQAPPTNTASPVPSTATPEPSPTATSTASPTPSLTPLPASATLLAQNQEPVFVSYEFMQGQLTPPNGVFLVGDMLSISLCAVPGIGAGNAVRDLLMTVSIGTAELDPTTRVIEIGIVDCANNNQEQRVIAVPRDQVEAYARGEITLQQLQQAVQPVR